MSRPRSAASKSSTLVPSALVPVAAAKSASTLAPAPAPAPAPAVLGIVTEGDELEEKKEAPPPPALKEIRMARPTRVGRDKSAAAMPPAETLSVSQPPSKRIIPYKEQIQNAMRELEEKRDMFLKLDAVNEEGRLGTYSTKLDKLLRNLEQTPGSNLVYSQFKTVEGLGVLGISLKANGYSEIVIQGSDADPFLSPATVASFEKGPASGEKRFILFTGEGSKERRALILNLFNGNLDKLPPTIQKVLVSAGYEKEKNIRGAICWVIGITGAGAEGISLKCCRAVHILESYWNNVRLDQVKGRAIRICSHTDLPYAERTVDIYTYCSVFSEEQKRSKLDINIKTVDNNETSDERVLNVSLKKDKINQAILDVMKSAAVDCGLNSADLDNVQCLQIDSAVADQYMFDPDLEVDKRITGIQFKRFIEAQQKALAEVVAEEKSAIPSSASEAAQQAVSLSTGKVPLKATSAPKVPKMKLESMRYDGKPYLLVPYPFNKWRFKMFSAQDTSLRKPLGETEFDPLTKSPSRVTLYPNP